MPDPFPFGHLGRPLSSRDRALVSRALGALVRWQGSLRGFRVPARAPDATPFVSLYVSGMLRGCMGTGEGRPAERLARAFVLALGDARFGGVTPTERASLVAEVAYPSNPRLISAATAAREIEPGSHGLAFVGKVGPTAVLLPAVGRDERLGADALLEVLARKARVSRADLEHGRLYAFETEVVTSRVRARDRDAAAWLAERIGSGGAVEFAVDARVGRRFASGEFGLGRAAVVIQALAAAGVATARVARARKWLLREIGRALTGTSVDGFPTSTSRAAGTLALAVIAGVDVRRPLFALASRIAVKRDPWHAAQVVAALGPEAPRGLYLATVAHLDVQPWAPWTMIAARRMSDGPVIERCERALVASIRTAAPHAGGASVTAVPEIALTALVVEALGPSRSKPALDAVRRARAFLQRWQLVGNRVPAALDAALAAGAFPASPVVDVLRTDVTAHALLALL